MTEADWDDAAEPQPLLQHLRGSGVASERKLRLFVIGVCRRAPSPLLGADGWEAVLAVAEWRADGQATAAGVLSAAARAARFRPGTPSCPPRMWWDWQLAEVVLGPLEDAASFCRRAAAQAHEAANDRYAVLRAPGGGEVAAARASWAKAEAAAAAERAHQCHLLRDLLNPFRPLRLDPAWRTPTVASLAHAAYEYRLLPGGQLDRARLLVLADALLDAGCGDAVLLEHLRSEGPHWRGCWAVDAVLGKS